MVVGRWLPRVALTPVLPPLRASRGAGWLVAAFPVARGPGGSLGGCLGPESGLVSTLGSSFPGSLSVLEQTTCVTMSFPRPLEVLDPGLGVLGQPLPCVQAATHGVSRPQAS